MTKGQVAFANSTEVFEDVDESEVKDIEDSEVQEVEETQNDEVVPMETDEEPERPDEKLESPPKKSKLDLEEVQAENVSFQSCESEKGDTEVIDETDAEE